MRKAAIFYVTITVLALATAGVALSLSDDDPQYFANGSEESDLVQALDNAKPGDTVKMSADYTFNSDTLMKIRVTLDTNGHKLTVADNKKLTINGKLVSTGDIRIGEGSTLLIPWGSEASFDGGNIELLGSIDVKGTMNIGTKVHTKISGGKDSSFTATGKISLNNADVNVGNVSVSTGELNISNDSSLFASGNLVVGEPHTLITKMDCKASVKGKISLGKETLVTSYCDSSFGTDNIKSPFLKTVFEIKEKVYATQYGGNPSERTISLPDCKELRDYDIKWVDKGGKPATAAKIGYYDVLKEEMILKVYKVSFVPDERVNWIVNNISYGSGKVEKFPYEKNLSVSIKIKPGYDDNLYIKVDGDRYNGGDPYIVTGDTEFTVVTGGNQSNTLLTILTVILMGSVLLLVGAIFYVKYLKPAPKQPRKKKNLK